jgi:DNA-binding MarR family transcriptional regulator
MVRCKCKKINIQLLNYKKATTIRGGFFYKALIIDVYTCIFADKINAILKLEKAIQSRGFINEKQKAVVNIMYTAYRVKTIISQALKAYALTPEQYNVLRILNGSYPEKMCVKDIAQRMIERSSNVPRIVDRLETKKLVKRSQSGEDKRETVILLSQAGINMLEAVNPALEKINAKMSDMSEAEARQLNDLLDRYLKE